MAPDRRWLHRLLVLGVGLLLIGCDDPTTALLWELRLVRDAVAILVGAGLSIAGALLQSVMRNDLVEPGILGLNAGGNLAAMIALLIAPQLALISPVAMALVAWTGALSTCLLVFLLARGPGGFHPTQLLLTGIGVGAVVSALSVPIAMLAPVHALFMEAAFRREIGALSAADLSSLVVIAPFVALLGPAAWLMARPLDLLALGEDSARSLSLQLGRTRILALAVAAGLSGACVAVGGGMAFVGLLAPHIARHLVGSRMRRLLPVAAGVGGVLVLAADQIGAHLLPHGDVPAGLLVAALGAPYLLYRLMR